MTNMALPVLAGSEEIARDALVQELDALIDGEVRFGHHDRMLYSTDASLYQVEPLGVVIPRHVDDVRRIVRFCRDQHLPILPRGGGTSLAGQTTNRAVVVDCSVHCNALVDVKPKDSRARVEPGVVLDDLNAALHPYGLMFGPDVATSTHANLGGMIGNNSAGAHSILYGRTVEHLRGLRVVLSDGSELELYEGAASDDERVHALTARVADVIGPIRKEIRQHYPTIQRRVNGYNLDLLLDQLEASGRGVFDRVNLAHLMCGSEGTLAVTLEADLALVPVPRRKGLVLFSFADVDAALRRLPMILQSAPAAVELLDDLVIELALANRQCQPLVDLLPETKEGRAGAVLYVEYFGDAEADVTAQMKALSRRVRGVAMRRLTDPIEMQQVWQLRKAGEPLLHGMPGLRKPLSFIEDTAVDPERLGAFVRAFREMLARHGTRAAYYAHASVGCLHIRPMLDVHAVSDRRLLQRIAEEATELVCRFDGALSGEHGDGRARSPFLEQFYGETICNAFRQIKAVFDPENLLNPGNIVQPDPMLAHLRARPEAETVGVPSAGTFFQYRREQGLAAAVEQCNGAGVCRKTRAGVMCPSYRALRDERHSTRGRANALRLAITGQLHNSAQPDWNDAQTLATLDLCLSCKACKSECPSNVDVSKLKGEYIGQSRSHGCRVPLIEHVLGRVHTLNRVGSRWPGVFNWLASRRSTRWAAERMLGIDRRRSLPRFERSLRTWVEARHDRGSEVQDRPAVVLFPDCFTMSNESEVGRAAVNLLEAVGYRVILPEVGCCGRAMLSVGLMREACAQVDRTARALAAVVCDADPVAVVGCEPSCMSALLDDWPALQLRADAAAAVQRVHRRTSPIEDFLARAWEALPPAPQFREGEHAVVLHGHCHQKALWGTNGTEALLRRAVGDHLTTLDSGCCGMAGSFGLLKHRFDLSMAIGEQSLFRLLRDRGGSTVLAPGTSCRHQLRDGMGIEARHPIEWLAEQLPA